MCLGVWNRGEGDIFHKPVGNEAHRAVVCSTVLDISIDFFLWILES